MDQKRFEVELLHVKEKVQNLLIRQFNLNYFDAEDIFQNAALKAYKNSLSFKENASFGTWFLAIAKNEALTSIRKKQKIKKIENESIISNFSIPSLEKENLEKIEEMKTRMLEALNFLNKKHKEILELIIKDSLSNKEISLKLKIPINSVKTRLFYAKKSLKKLISSYELNSKY